MGTLYVVTIPASDPGDITFRALRILGEIPLLVATEDLPAAQGLLERHRIERTLQPAPGVRALLAALEQGDVALLADGGHVAPRGSDLGLIRAAIERQFPVVPVPGASLPIATLVASGLPAHTFAYLGELPDASPARLQLLTTVAKLEHTLVMAAACDRLAEIGHDLSQVLGERPLAVAPVPIVPAGEGSQSNEVGTPVKGGIWRGTTAGRMVWGTGPAPDGLCVLVVGGARGPADMWEESRLRDEIRARQDRGLRTRDISQELADVSGWTRREVYRLAVEQARDRARSKADRSRL